MSDDAVRLQVVVEVFDEEPNVVHPRFRLAVSEILNRVLRPAAIVNPVVADLDRGLQARFNGGRDLFFCFDERISSQGGQVRGDMPRQPNEVMCGEHWDEIEPELVVVWKNAVKAVFKPGKGQHVVFFHHLPRRHTDAPERAVLSRGLENLARRQHLFGISRWQSADPAPLRVRPEDGRQAIDIRVAQVRIQSAHG